MAPSRWSGALVCRPRANGLLGTVSSHSAEHDLDASEQAIRTGGVRYPLNLLPRRRHAIRLAGVPDFRFVDRGPRGPVDEHAVQLVREVAHG